MNIIENNSDNKKTPIVASIGFFDGVHLGHQFLIKQMMDEAKKESLPSAVITFVEHPRQVLEQGYQPALLCGHDEKMKRLASTGIDCCIPLHFTHSISRLSAQEFMQTVLKDRFNVQTLVIGYDHRFGYDREDGFKQYVKYGEELGIRVFQAKELDTGVYVSSSQIRTLLGEGEVEEVAKLLSYNYTLSGKIVEGFKVGRTIGFPTANMEVWERYKVVPAFGVYAVKVHVRDEVYKGMLYIGKRPTLQNSKNTSIEVNIFDFDEDLYGKELTLEFIQFVRPDVKFGGLEILKRQIAADKIAVQKVLDIKE